MVHTPVLHRQPGYLIDDRAVEQSVTYKIQSRGENGGVEELSGGCSLGGAEPEVLPNPAVRVVQVAYVGVRSILLVVLVVDAGERVELVTTHLSEDVIQEHCTVLIPLRNEDTSREITEQFDDTTGYEHKVRCRTLERTDRMEVVRVDHAHGGEVATDVVRSIATDDVRSVPEGRITHQFHRVVVPTEQKLVVRRGGDRIPSGRLDLLEQLLGEDGAVGTVQPLVQVVLGDNLGILACSLAFEPFIRPTYLLVAVLEVEVVVLGVGTEDVKEFLSIPAVVEFLGEPQSVAGHQVAPLATRIVDVASSRGHQDG